MKLSLTTTDNISEIKARFNNLYPYLKIEFVKRSHDVGQGSPLSDIISEDLTLAQLGGNNGEIHLSDSITVAELEFEFSDKLGVHIQVFRKSGDIWLETVTTDNWTLQEQNNHAYEKQQY